MPGPGILRQTRRIVRVCRAYVERRLNGGGPNYATTSDMENAYLVRSTSATVCAADRRNGAGLAIPEAALPCTLAGSGKRATVFFSIQYSCYPIQERQC